MQMIKGWLDHMIQIWILFEKLKTLLNNMSMMFLRFGNYFVLLLLIYKIEYLCGTTEVQQILLSFVIESNM